MSSNSPAHRRHVLRSKFVDLIAGAKHQLYSDPAVRRGPGHSLRTLAWSPLGNLIATGSLDRTIRIWNPEKPLARQATELQSEGTVEKVDWRPNKEAELVSVGSDGLARFWDVRAKSCINKVKVGGEAFTVAWMHDGETVLVGRKDDVLVPIDVKTYTAGAPLPQDIQTNQAYFSHSGEHLLLSTGSGRVKICSWPDMNIIHSLNGHTSACYALQISPRGDYIAVGGSDAMISLWDTRDFVCKHALSRMVGPVRSVSFSWDGSYIVGGSDEGLGIEIIHAASGEYVQTVPTANPAPVVAWHPSRYWLAYTGDPYGMKIVAAGQNLGL